MLTIGGASRTVADEPAATPWFDRFERTLSVLDRAVEWVIIVVMAVLVAVLVLQVVMRYGFNSSVSWGWVVPRICFVWVVFLGVPLALKRGLHVRVDLLLTLLSLKRRRSMARLLAALMIGLMAIVTYYATLLAITTWDQLMPVLDISVSVFYLALIICGVHSILHLVRAFWGGQMHDEADLPL